MFGFSKREDINKGVADFKATRGAVLIDVRSKEEYQNGHIPGSINIDVSAIESVGSRITNRSTPIFVHCLSGGRSGKAAMVLNQMGYKNVRNIGGIAAYSGPIER